MNNELLAVINQLERDRGIDREVLFQAVEFALQSATRKGMDAETELRVHLDRKTCAIQAFQTFEVADPATRPDQVSLDRAQQAQPGIQVGDTLEMPVQPRGLGRIAAQAAKQAIMQKIRQAERENVYETYKGCVGDVVSGTVRQVVRGEVLVELGRAEAIIPHKERVPNEEYQSGDVLRALILNVQDDPSSPSVILSRASPEFIRTLFRTEVSEIAEGIVEIAAIARDPGFRTKIAVRSHDEKVDPVGACVGMRGTRVKNIVRELNGEKIDIIRWNADRRMFATQALSPAKLISIQEHPDDPGALSVRVDSEQLALAIGRRGQNVRLASRLVGCRIDIQKVESEMTFEEQVQQAIENLLNIEGLSLDEAEILVANGFLSADGIQAVEAADLAEATGLDPADAERIWNATAEHAERTTGDHEESV